MSSWNETQKRLGQKLKVAEKKKKKLSQNAGIIATTASKA